jgi:hypothetical protein
LYTQAGTQSYGPQSISAGTYQDPSTMSSSQYPSYGQYRSQYQGQQYAGSQQPMSGQPRYTDQPYAAQPGTLPSWAYQEPPSRESSTRYPVSSQFQPGGGYGQARAGYGAYPGQAPVEREHYSSYYQPSPSYGQTTYGPASGQVSPSGISYGGYPQQAPAEREHYSSYYQPSPTSQYSQYGASGQYSGQPISGHVPSWGQQNPQATSLPEWAKTDLAAEQRYREQQQRSQQYGGSYATSRSIQDPSTGRLYGPY